MATEWFYSNDGKQFGPVSSTELKQLSATGEINADTLVWKEGLKNWARAAAVKGLCSASPPPLPIRRQTQQLLENLFGRPKSHAADEEKDNATEQHEIVIPARRIRSEEEEIRIANVYRSAANCNRSTGKFLYTISFFCVFILLIFFVVLIKNKDLPISEQLANFGRTFAFLLIMAVITMAYCLPTIIAAFKLRSWKMIFALNIAAAWTGFGWLALMGYVVFVPGDTE